MNQFKPIFLGTVQPGSPLFGMKRAVNSQKCIRAGGKHNDLDDVGKDTYHHTFFEMLGNWSFGDYFKKEAVEWSWELLTRVYGIPADRLYATYFGGNLDGGLEPDEETKQLWLRFLPPSHVLPGNMKDNFWEMGETGPCGPCTEIHFDRIGGRDAHKLVNTGDPDVIEVWNNVFIQFNREEGGKLRLLPAKHVDTGMGFERLVSVLQNKRSNYDTDVFMPYFAAIQKVTGFSTPYSGKLGAADAGNVDTAYRVIADHIRTLTFAITDGATPSNEGRGYVLRRILRRAVRYGRQVLNAKPGFFSQLVPTVVERMGEAFPELRKNPQRVIDILREEEESFGKTLDRGIGYANQIIQQVRYSPIQRAIDALNQVDSSFVESIVKQYGEVVLPPTNPIVTSQSPDYETQKVAYQTFSARTSALRYLQLSSQSVGWVDRFWSLDRTIDELERSFRRQCDLIQDAIDKAVEPIPEIVSDLKERGISDLAQRFEAIREQLSTLRPATWPDRFRTLMFPADDAFKLYDTYGFPIDLTQQMAEERGLKVDIAGYERLMEEAKDRSRAAGREGAAKELTLGADAIARLKGMNVSTTDDGDKFHGRTIHATVLAIWNGENFDDSTRDRAGAPVGIILDKTSFYAEMGGQVTDQGEIHADRAGGAADFNVESVKSYGGYILHIGRAGRGELRVGDRVRLHVDRSRRDPIEANHTATHMLNFALRRIVGPHVDQKGSLVAPDRLRFDFSNTGPVAPDQLAKVESIVRDQIAADLTVYADLAPQFVAKQITGLRAVFGETYPDPVRVVSIGQPVSDLLASPGSTAWMEVSVEFCGGTHVPSTSKLGHFALISEEAVAKGIRRVTALTGVPALAAIQSADNLAARIQAAERLEVAALATELNEVAREVDQLTIPAARRDNLRKSIAALQEKVKAAQKQAAAGKRQEAAAIARRLAESANTAGDTIIVSTIDLGSDRGALEQAVKTIRDVAPRAAVMLFSPDESDPAAPKIGIMASVPPDAVAKGLNAGDWLREAATICGGKGGGKPEAAQGGGTNVAKLREAIAAARLTASKKLL
jgi:alanyl-tRNA synthetase